MAKKRVAIVGAGAAGMSAAYALSKHPDRYEVTVFDKEPVAGGMASSMDVDPARFGAGHINDGVQGCSPAFANTLRIFRELGFPPEKVEMQISFGQGEDFWTNVFPSPLTERLAPQIRKFGRVLRTVKRLEGALALLPIRALLRLFGLSKDFGERMVYPLAALFFGTGNQTPYVASAILERVFMDPSMRLFEYDERSLLASIPEMYAFQKLSDTYTAWQHKIAEADNVTFLLGHEVLRVVKRTRTRTVLEYRAPSSDAPLCTEFDALILATDADAARTLLGEQAGWLERHVLGGVKYLHDLTVTHTDAEYMRKHYETQFRPGLLARSATDAEFERATKSFRPLYYTYQYPDARAQLEMSFDLTYYQPQLSEDRAHVFQTIFLDRDGCGARWTKREIAGGEVVGERWWKQQSHRWQHYARVVPWMWAINGTRGTYYAGAWTGEWLDERCTWGLGVTDVVPAVLNMHEIGITSGFAAAYRLGADFPHLDDEECTRLFRLYMGLSHGSRLRKEDRKGVVA
ncbi:hypothetical protein BC834DRAFT_627943 [Gloeopeniophorella convolvens]|nr:hypothetical protein BC834DRAFT_627943 [Gloeopeniophorella convolvens]